MSMLVNADGQALAGMTPNEEIQSATITGTTNAAGNMQLFPNSNKIILCAYCTSTENVCLSVNRSGDGALWVSANQRGTMTAITSTSLTVLVYYIEV